MERHGKLQVRPRKFLPDSRPRRRRRVPDRVMERGIKTAVGKLATWASVSRSTPSVTACSSTTSTWKISPGKRICRSGPSQRAVLHHDEQPGQLRLRSDAGLISSTRFRLRRRIFQIQICG